MPATTDAFEPCFFCQDVSVSFATDDGTVHGSPKRRYSEKIEVVYTFSVRTVRNGSGAGTYLFFRGSRRSPLGPSVRPLPILEKQTITLYRGDRESERAKRVQKHGKTSVVIAVETGRNDFGYQLRSSRSGLLVSPPESEDVNDSRRGTNAEAEGLLLDSLCVPTKAGSRAGVLGRRSAESFRDR